ncbi:unnamed protein product [Microthlaspi erraticum]|nr:unnamed protein product [Microthlaspi erraticum]
MENLGGLTMFVSVNSCESRTYVDEGMLRNSVYFPKLCDDETRCVRYSFDERRYDPVEHSVNWGKQSSSEDIWIKAPEYGYEMV